MIMYLLAPANAKQLIDRAWWFKTPSARRLAREKGVEFGFELKGEPETITEAPPLFWGYHLPNEFASTWYYRPKERPALLAKVKHLAALKPDYVNFHGVHLWYQPDPKDKIDRYRNRSNSDEYLKVLDSNIDLIKSLQKALPGVRLTMENYPLYMYYMDEDKYLPETFLYTGSGRLNDLLYLREKTGVELLLDIEHLILTLNFLNREKNYASIPVHKLQGVENSAITQKLYEIFGFYIKEDLFPYVDEKVKYEDMVKKIGAKIYHLTGSTQDVIPGVRDVTHGPIETDDMVFRKNLRAVLAQKPDALLSEVATPADNACFKHLKMNESELSFANLCEILLKEL